MYASAFCVLGSMMMMLDLNLVGDSCLSVRGERKENCERITSDLCHVGCARLAGQPS
ncbi:hypothetical protein RDABS01_006655 [Bienertia sinuspersici]